MEYYIWWVAVVGNIMSCITRAGFDGDHEARELAREESAALRSRCFQDGEVLYNTKQRCTG